MYKMAKRLDNKGSPINAKITFPNSSTENSVEDDQLSTTTNSVENKEDDQSSIQTTSNREGKRIDN